MRLHWQVLTAALLAGLWAPTAARSMTLRVHYDAGLGHSVALRGNAEPLRWDVGVLALFAEDNLWVWTSPPGMGAFEFKPLLDDQTWSTGGNFRVPAGVEAVDVFPFFGPARGRLETIPGIGAPGLSARKLLVYLPPSYSENLAKRYPLLLLHDGQNLFDRRTSASTIEWQVDETLDALVAGGRAREVIAVGIENTPERIEEYTPSRDPDEARGGVADRYLDFLEQLVLPLLRSRYRTLDAPRNTLMMGSSLGGLLSFYAGWTRSGVYGAVGCLSSSFWWNREEWLHKVQAHRGPRPPVRVYLDSGGKHDGARRTARMHKALLHAGWRDGDDLFFHADPHGIHTESSWAERLHLPLEALLPFQDEVLLTPSRAASERSAPAVSPDAPRRRPPRSR